MRMNEGYMNVTMRDREIGMERVKPGSLAEDSTNKRAYGANIRTSRMILLSDNIRDNLFVQ